MEETRCVRDYLIVCRKTCCAIDAMISGDSAEIRVEHPTLRTSAGVVGESPVGTLPFPSPIQPRLVA